MVLNISFLTVNNVYILCLEQNLTWKFYITAKILSIIKHIKLINIKKFNKIAINKNIKIFVIYITSLSLSLILIYWAKKAKISLLIIEKIKIFNKYLNFINIFSEKKASILPKITKFNQYIIKLKKDYQLSYRLIYSLDIFIA